jgi:hypothetical protein
MGQQQLLLLVLAAVIVGTAVVLGINMFSQNAAQANQDAVLQDMMTIAAKAQAWFARPAEMGGGGRSFIKLDDTDGWGLLNFPKTNANGTYKLTPAAKTITIDGDGVEGKWTAQVVADSAKITSSKITP